MSNKGIVIQGRGTINAGQLAVGDHASVHGHGMVGNDALAQKLDALLKEIQTASLPPARRSELVDAVEGMKREAQSPKPRKSVLEKGLAFVNAAVSSVSGVAAAAKVVKEALDLFVF